MRIGFIGLGIMGEPMCENIIKKHDDKVYGYDHHEENIAKIVAAGGISCASEREIAENSDIIITMVPKSEHSKAVYEGILDLLDATKTCIDMSTIDPAVSVEISKSVKKTGAAFVDAPVVKSQPAAVTGKLGIYVGGDEDVFDRIKPILLYMGENVVRMGENGKGLVMKICHNALVSQIQNGVNETITLAAQNGIDVLKYAEAISYGGGWNSYLDSKKNAIAQSNFTTAFSIENMAKDVTICTNLAKKSGVAMPGGEVVSKVYEKALQKGFAKEDFSATIKVVREK